MESKQLQLQLQNQNKALVQENKQLKKDFEKLQRRYDKLKDLYVASVKKTIESELKLKELNMMSKIATNFAAYFNEVSSEDEEFDMREDHMEMIDSKVTPYVLEESITEKVFEQFLIIEPNITTKQFQISYIYPNNNAEYLNHIHKRLLTFIFPKGVHLEEIEDDTEESRKNQIIFGSQGELLEFILENDCEESFNQLLTSTNLKRKYYCYVYVKPHIPASIPKHVHGRKKHIESERAFIFISKFPFMQFFNDLNKSIQQTVKLLHLSDKPMDSIRKDYNIINKILKKIFQTKLQNFPVDKSWKTQISEVKLNASSQNSLLVNQRKYFTNNIFHLFSNVILSKLIHYILIESHLLIFCSNRELLNNILGFIKTIIYPLMWEFSTIYTLNNDLLPFLEAPFPILIGVNKSRVEIQNTQWNLESFILFDVENLSFINDERQEKLILDSWKKLTSDLNKDRQMDKEKDRDKDKGKILGTISVIEQFIEGLIKKSKANKGAKLSQFQKQIFQTQMMITYLSN